MPRRDKPIKQIQQTIEVTDADETIETVQVPTVQELEQQGYKSKAARVRYLLSQGFEVKQIAKAHAMLYQHVYNIKVTPLKKTA